MPPVSTPVPIPVSALLVSALPVPALPVSSALPISAPPVSAPPVSAPPVSMAAVRHALDSVIDPELDEPVTDLGFVRSVAIESTRVEVHMRLPTSFCAPNFAYLMASDAKDALAAVPGVTEVVVELDDHHDSELINCGLAANAGYRGTFGHEAEQDLDELRATFRRKAHTAAMERCLTALLRSRSDLAEDQLGEVVIADLPDDDRTAALLRRRTDVGLDNHSRATVLVDEHGRGYPPDDVPLALRRARSTRISVDGNAHFCRGLLRTRYPGAESDQAPRDDEAFFSLIDLKHTIPTTTPVRERAPRAHHSARQEQVA